MLVLIQLSRLKAVKAVTVKQFSLEKYSHNTSYDCARLRQATGEGEPGPETSGIFRFFLCAAADVRPRVTGVRNSSFTRLYILQGTLERSSSQALSLAKHSLTSSVAILQSTSVIRGNDHWVESSNKGYKGK